MKFEGFVAIFHRLPAALFMISSTDGLPAVGNKKVPESKSVVLGESVYETIEEIITCAANEIPLLADDEIRLKIAQSLLEDDQETSQGAGGGKTESPSATESKLPTTGSTVIVASPSIRKVITLSVAKNLAHYLPVKDDEQIHAWLASCLGAGASSSPVSGTPAKTAENLPEKPKVDAVHEQITETPSTTSEKGKNVVSSWTDRSFAEMVKKPSLPPTSQQRDSAAKPEFASISQQRTPTTPTPHSFSGQQRGPSAMNKREFFNRQRKGPASASASSSTQNFSRESHSNKSMYSMIIEPKTPKMNVIDELVDMEINLKSFGVVTSRLLPSKSLVVSCVSQEMMHRLRDVIVKSGRLKVSEKKTGLKYEVRLYLKKDTPEDKIMKAVFNAFGEYPSEIIYIPFKGDQRRADDLEVVLLLVSSALYRKMEKNQNLPIDGWRTRIDTEIRLDRCDKCKLLGHREKFCLAETVRPWPDPLDDCLDCIEFNKRQRERYGDAVYKLNDAKHRMGADNCPSKQFYMNEYRRSRDGNDRSDAKKAWKRPA